MFKSTCRKMTSCGMQIRQCSHQFNNEAKKLSGKVAIVTASTDGIGYAIAKRLAENGASVVISSRKQDNVTKALNLLQGLNLEVTGVVCHVGKSEDRKKLIDTTLEKYGQLDIMVSNAGINPVAAPILETPEKAWDKIFDINVKSAYLLAKECGRHLKETKGSMIFISSIGGYMPFPMLGAYSVSKTALIGLVKCLAQECAPSGVRVNGIAPGVIKTQMSKLLTDTPDMSKMILTKIPMKRFAVPDEIGGAIVFLSSDDASYITGEMLTIAGGMSARL